MRRFRLVETIQWNRRDPLEVVVANPTVGDANHELTSSVRFAPGKFLAQDHDSKGYGPHHKRDGLAVVVDVGASVDDHLVKGWKGGSLIS